MKEHDINLLDNFIGAWYLNDLSICDELIQAHKDSPNKTLGRSKDGEVNVSIKKSIDCSLLTIDKKILAKYADECKLCVSKYIEKYPMANEYAAWKPIESPNIQHYKPGEAFHAYHTERYSNDTFIASRHLVFMTYLNDVFDGGETEFFHQKLKVRPEKGLNLIWPTDWTYTHRGIPSPTEDKYIVTGWYSFY